MSRSVKVISQIAYHLLNRFNITEPFIDVRKIAENIGILVKEDFFSNDISGLLATKNNKTICGVNQEHHENRKRFTIAHEIGHFVLKHERNGLFIDQSKNFSGLLVFRNNDSSTGEKAQEREANAFAAALLMPESMIRAELIKLESLTSNNYDLGDEKGVNIISTLAEEFKVSEQAMSFRFLNLRL